MKMSAVHPSRLVPILLMCCCFTRPLRGQAVDPLPSWNEGVAKRKIMEFVASTTNVAGPGFVPEDGRIAVFDNDGTLWPEKPVIEGMFVLQRINAMAEKDPSLRNREPFKAALMGDTAYLREAGEEAIAKLVAASHTGMTQEEFAADAEDFYRTAHHPRLGIPLAYIAYQPMVELLAYLRSNRYQTWICSGGTLEFMRVFSQPLYGIPPQQVIGTAINLEFAAKGGKGRLLRNPGLAYLNDKEMKPVDISRHIGLRPLLAAGNVRSGGDIAMLTYSRSGTGLSLQLLINHDDPEREFAYREPDGASLRAAKTQGWILVSMKEDWKRVFGSGEGREEAGSRGAGAP